MVSVVFVKGGPHANHRFSLIEMPDALKMEGDVVLEVQGEDLFLKLYLNLYVANLRQGMQGIKTAKGIRNDYPQSSDDHYHSKAPVRG